MPLIIFDLQGPREPDPCSYQPTLSRLPKVKKPNSNFCLSLPGRWRGSVPPFQRALRLNRLSAPLVGEAKPGGVDVPFDSLSADAAGWAGVVAFRVLNPVDWLVEEVELLI